MIRAGLFVLFLMASAASPLRAAEAPASNLSELVLAPHPGAALPLQTGLTDETGRAVTLGQFFTGKPVIIVFDYLRCTTICGLALRDLAEAAGKLPTPPRVLAISIDPRDTPADAAEARHKYRAQAGGSGDWHFLTGPETEVRPIADAAGFHYRYDTASDQYIHSVGYVVAGGGGTVSTYLPDIGITPQQLQAALDEAAQGRTASSLRRLLLLCFGGAVTGRFTPAIEIALILFNLAAMVGAAALFARRVRRRAADAR